MYVLVHHAIHDPKHFWSQAEQAIPNLPTDLKLHHTLTAKDGTRATCLWEAESVQAVRDFLEPALGSVSTNEYAPAENRDGIALPSQPAEADAAGVARAIYEIFNARDFGRLAKLVAPDAEITQVPTGITQIGPAGVEAFMRGWLRAFPDAHVEIVNLVGTGNRVASEILGRGTHTGPLVTPGGEIGPSGRKVQLPVAEFYEVQNGRVVRFREHFDVGTLLAQIGAAQPATPPAAEPLPPAR